MTLTRSRLLALATLTLLAGGAIEVAGQSDPAPTKVPGPGNASEETLAPTERDHTAMPAWTVIQPRSKAARDVWFDAMAALPSGEVVVVGQGMERGRPARAFVFDPSDSESWQTVSLPGRKRALSVDVVAQDGGLIAAGNALPKDGPPQVLIWRSPEGRSWQRPMRIDDAEARDLLATDDGVALLGMTWDEARRPVPTLGRSTDGQTFEADPVAEPGHMARRVTRSPTGTWVVVGQRTTGDGYDAEHVLYPGRAPGSAMGRSAAPSGRSPSCRHRGRTCKLNSLPRRIGG
jgi:hypothetical protein